LEHIILYWYTTEYYSVDEIKVGMNIITGGHLFFEAKKQTDVFAASF